MRAADFIFKWGDSELRERQGAQEHFIDLCRLLGEPTPAEDDPRGERYCFERGARKTGHGGDGWADVWRKGCFGWEYKGKHKNLGAALRQLQAYALDLENPPYLVVSDMDRIEITTNWTNTVSKTYVITLEDLRDAGKLDILRQVFQGSEKLKPGLSPQDLTAKAATTFGALGKRLQDRGHPPRAVAHFLNRLVFCMFAEDSRLLPEKLFTQTMKALVKRPRDAERQLSELFSLMATKGGGLFGFLPVRWFNGGLFEDGATLPLPVEDIKQIADLAEAYDWSEIDPAIFGTLFEQALKATRERPALGAHYTDRDKILKIIEPVIIRPLATDWVEARASIAAAMEDVASSDAARKAVHDKAAADFLVDAAKAKAGEVARRKELATIAKARDAALGRAKAALETYLARLGAFRVLDPACGSGNFLYVALHELMNLERRALVDAERLGVTPPAPRVGLQCVLGIEIEAYAAELARMTLWIGYLQWLKKNQAMRIEDPVLSSLDQIENRDALLNEDGTEAEWPKVDVIVGNPPFVGRTKMIEKVGQASTDRLRSVFDGRLNGNVDFVVYWIEKSCEAIETGRADKFGFVTTQSIRRLSNRQSIEHHPAVDLFESWPDEPWVVEGAQLRVSMFCASHKSSHLEHRYEDKIVNNINSDLSAVSVDTTKSVKLLENKEFAFEGTKKYGPFEIPRETAVRMITQPINPNGRPNSDVVKPWSNADDIIDGVERSWIIDFGVNKTESEATFYEMPFKYSFEVVKPSRDALPDGVLKSKWWIFERSRPALRKAIAPFSRVLATPRTC